MVRKRLLMTVALICTFIFVGNVRAARLLSFVGEQRGWMVGFGSDVYHTEDGGEHWKKQSTPTGRSLHSVFFVDPQHGWAVGDGGTILRTSNGVKFFVRMAPPIRHTPLAPDTLSNRTRRPTFGNRG